uniref:Uncharacterized protein n=1 Tax=uncultured bacterium A1Q1_fos_97 TaxID=1256593 RepID=L7W2J5_9BACT|nr:hypothetical protein [uncultured bacterium A1Q1_fos_97]
MAGQAQGAQLPPSIGITQTSEFLTDETVIKAGIVGHKNGSLGHFYNFTGHLKKTRGLFHHLVIDARQYRNVPGNGRFGIDEAFPTVDDLMAIVQNYGDFGNAITRCFSSSCFYINNGIFFFHSILLVLLDHQEGPSLKNNELKWSFSKKMFLFYFFS